MSTQYRSDAMAAVHETMEALNDIGAIDRQTMRRFDEICLVPDEGLTPEFLEDLCKQLGTRKQGPVMSSAGCPAKIVPGEDGSGYHARFRGLPKALTRGDDVDHAITQAADCLAEAIAGRIARGDAIPQPSKPRRGERPIGMPLYLAPKLAFYLAMRERGLRNTELAKRLGVSETVVRRMLNPRHDTKPEKIQTALAALGSRFVVRLEDAA